MIILIAESWPTLAFFGVLLLVLLLARLLLKANRFPYEKRPSVLTESERRFYHVLSDAIADRFKVLAMVRMADLIRVKKGTTGYQSWQNRIQAKHIDFVLCDPDSLEAVLAIELDDPTHQQSHRQQRDEFVNSAFEDAQLPLLRIPTASSYDSKTLRKSIDTEVRRQS